MGCESCLTGACGTNGLPNGCKSNGGCSSGGCNKLNSFDWLSDMGIMLSDGFDVVEVKFKGGRKEFFRNIEGLDLTTGDPVVVEMPSGHHVGFVSLQGELVRLQLRKKNIADVAQLKKIYRKAHKKDLEKFEEVKKRELPSLFRTREIIQSLKLQMKLSDIEYQADSTKATFFYSADDRVDFRELIKLLASEFKVRVEMRQISLRQEASRLGGLGSCGRELCCSTWLTEFKSVSTGAARYQNLSLNPSKLSGQCGRLKCCLNYELETYLDALIDIPKIEKSLSFDKGAAYLQKVDIFKQTMWFSFEGDHNNWFSLSAQKVKSIIQKNAEGIDAPSEDLFEDEVTAVETVSLNADLERLDKKFVEDGNGNKRKKKSRRKKKTSSAEGMAKPSPEKKQRPQSPRNKPQRKPQPEGTGSTKRNEGRPTSKRRRPPKGGNGGPNRDGGQKGTANSTRGGRKNDRGRNGNQRNKE